MDDHLVQNGNASQKYVDILTNGGFKALFGDENNKEVVMDILNVLLPENRKVVSIEYMPTEYQGQVVNKNKEFHYDFMCRDASGVVFIVELQKYYEDHWFKRCVCYASRAYDKQNRRGEDVCREGWRRRSKLRRKARRWMKVSLSQTKEERELFGGEHHKQCHGKKDQERRTGRVSCGFGKRGHWWHY